MSHVFAAAPALRPHPARRGVPAELTGLLALQRQVGNRAVADLIAQRCGDTPPGKCACHGNDEDEEQVQRLTAEAQSAELTSDKYKGQPRLEAAFDNAPALGIGERGDGVRLVQEGLVAEGHPMPKSTLPGGEMDGKFGGETKGAVADFQRAKALPGVGDGRVGRHTMGKLDELAKGGGGGGGGGGNPTPAQVCGDPPCGQPYVELKKGLFVSLCDNKLAFGSPRMAFVGCGPSGLVPGGTPPGNVGLFSPSWTQVAPLSICGTDDPSIQIGHIQTVAWDVDSAVYEGPKGAPIQGPRTCVQGARDCLGTAPPPWFAPPGANFGPQPMGPKMTALTLHDQPFLAKLKSHLPDHPADPKKQNLRAFPLLMISLTGVFHIWLIARRKDGTVVFIHNWTVGLDTRATRTGPDPCGPASWAIAGGAKGLANASGQGGAAPNLTGACANSLTKPC